MNIVKLIKKCFTKNTPIIKSIVAVDMNNGIGKDGNLLFPISADMKHFVASTRGDAVIMRSGTFESFSKRPLKNRLNIVISRRKNYDGNGAQVVQTLDAALDLVSQSQHTTAWIIGGAGLYAEALPVTHEIYLTQIFAEKPADTYFPEFTDMFEKISEQGIMHDEKNNVDFQFQIWKNKKLD